MTELIIETKDENELEKEIETQVEFTYTIDYINGAAAALTVIDDMDTAIMNKSDELRVKRIKRKALRILDMCITEYYDELFDDDDE